MSQSRTRFIGMEVHKDSSAVAYVAQDHGAEVMPLGPSAHVNVTSSTLSARCHRKPNISSSSTKPAPVATGSTGISAKKATTAGGWHRLCSPKTG